MTTTHLRRTIATAVLVLAGTLPVVAAGPATAQGGGDDVVRRGSCSGSADWKIKAKPDDGRIEVEARGRQQPRRPAVALGAAAQRQRLRARHGPHAGPAAARSRSSAGR